MTCRSLCKVLFVSSKFFFIYLLTSLNGNSQDLTPLVKWEVLLGEAQGSEKAERAYSQGMLQESIWLLEDEGFSRAADLVKNYLRFILSRGQVDREKIKDLGLGGTTETKRIELPFGISAVFKPKSMHPSSSYHSEVAAYLVDQLGGFRLVPMTVGRKILGRKGSLQYFIRNAQSVAKIDGFRKSPNLNVFDFIINNMDRNEGNILLGFGREVAIDHGLSLRSSNLLGNCLKLYDKIGVASKSCTHPVRSRWLHPSSDMEEFLSDAIILGNLKRFSTSLLEPVLSPYLSRKKIKSLLYRTWEFLGYYEQYKSSLKAG